MTEKAYPTWFAVDGRGLSTRPRGFCLESQVGYETVKYLEFHPFRQ